MIVYNYICDQSGFSLSVKQHPLAGDPLFVPSEWIETDNPQVPGTKLLFHRASCPALDAAIPAAIVPASGLVLKATP